MEVSCSTWGRSTEVRCCLHTVWDNCADSIARLVCTAAPADHSGVAGATTGEVTLLSAIFALGFQAVGQPGIRTQAASGTAVGQQLPQGPQPAPPGEPLDDSPLPNCSIRDVVLTDRDKQLLSELRRSGIGTHPTSAECTDAASVAWGGGRYKMARSAVWEQGRSKTPGPTGGLQEHLDAIVSELARGGACSLALTFSR